MSSASVNTSASAIGASRGEELQAQAPALSAPHALGLAAQLRHWARTQRDTVALRQKDFGIWTPISWGAYEEAARHFGLGLQAAGLPTGGHCAIISENRKEWVFAQLGCAMVGGVTVGIYPTSPADEVRYLLDASDADMVLCEDQEQLDKVLDVKDRLPRLGKPIVIDVRGLRRYDAADWTSFDAICALGRAYEASHPQFIEHCLARQSMSDTALMIFTSGSTGKPKAAMLSYGNISAMAAGTDAIFQCTPADSSVSYLPLCHVAEQIYSVYLSLRCGTVVNFSESLRTVQSDLREIAPTLFLGVPRIWEKLHASIEVKIRETGRLRRWLYTRALAFSLALTDKPRKDWSISERLLSKLFYIAVLRSLCNFTGLRRCRLALSGAAPIAPQVLRFFRAIGVPVREAYGMTETAGIATVQRSSASPIGSVGQAVPGVELRLASDGELLIRGATVFKAYYRNPEASREAIDADGWLHTGDIARFTGQEISIIDRKKDVMITAGGKNISPSEIENSLRFSSYIKEAIVVADRRAYVTALLQIDFETVGQWAETRGVGYTHFRSLAEHASVRMLIQEEVNKVNNTMPQVQHVRRFHLLLKELDHDDGEVTATMKIKRSSIAEKYHGEIEALYAFGETKRI